MKKIYYALAAFCCLTVCMLPWESVHAQTIDCFPYTQTFDTWTFCGTTCGNACTAEDGWLNATDDTQDWTTDANGTGSSSTGPSSDHTSGAGNYLYLETSSPCNGGDDSAHIETPYVDLTGVGQMSMIFWRNMYGADMDSLFVDIRTITATVPGPWTMGVTGYTDNIDLWKADTIDLAAYVGTIIQIRFRGRSGSSFHGDMAIDDVTFMAGSGLDAALTSFDAPSGVIVPGPNPASVTITNVGSVTLTSATIEWTVNGTPQPAFPWTGSLAQGANVSTGIGTANLTTGPSTLVAWITNPNGMADIQACNDTASSNVCTSYPGGVYTVGAAMNFATPQDAIAELATCGILGSIRLDIAPGVYPGQLIVPPIPGAGPSASICFDGADTALVSIENSALATILYSGGSYVSFKNVTIRNSAASNGFGVMLMDTANYDSIVNCHILMPTTTNSSILGIVSSSSTTSGFSNGWNSMNCYIGGNHIENGYYGIRLNGDVSTFNLGNKIENNRFEGNDNYNVYCRYQDSIEVVGNWMGQTNSTFGDGITFFDVMNFSIESNTILEAQDFGIYISDGNFDFAPSRRGRVINNLVSSVSDYALYMDQVNETDFFHNTFAGLYGMRMNDIQDSDFRNNIFVGTGNNAFLSVDGFASLVNVTFDFNVYQSPMGTDLVNAGGTLYADLIAVQAAVPADNVASLEGDPFFANGLADLHLVGAIANDAGDNGAGVMVDIDGDARPQAPSTTVDIGADEYTPLATNAAFLAITEPTGLACGDSNTAVYAVIQNLGSTMMIGTPVTVDVSGDITATLTLNYPDTLLFGEMDTILMGMLNTYNGGTFSMTGWVAEPGDQDLSNDTLVSSVSATFISIVPAGYSASGCGADSVEIFGNPYPGVIYNFYANMTDTIPLASGSSYLIPSLAAQSTYFMDYAANADTLLTTFAAGNGHNGNMFDLVGLAGTTITGFAGNLNAGTHTVDIWTRTGSYVGFEGSSAGWTLVGTATGVVSAGQGSPTDIPIPVNVSVPAGQTVAFYIDCSGSVGYTNGTAAGSVYVQNTYFQFLEGAGIGAGFSATFSPRIWNGVIKFGGSACGPDRVAIMGIQGAPAQVDLGADTSYCDTSVVLDAGAGYSSFLWSVGDTTQMSTVNASGSYSVAVVDTNNCPAWDTVDITLSPNPVVDLGVDTTICSGDSLMLDAGNPGSNYLWSNSATTQMNTVSSGTYSVTLLDTNGCPGEDTIVIASQSVMVNLGADTTLCDGAALVLDAGSGASFLWSSADTSQMISVNMAGAYFVDVWDSLGCVGSDTISINTETSPVAAFTFLISGAGLTYDFTYTGTANAVNYSWDFGDASPIDNSMNPSHTYAVDGNYTVLLTIDNGCGIDTISQSLMVVGVEQGLRPESVGVYPNPNQGNFTLSFTSYNGSDVKVEIFNLQGKVVFNQVFEQVIGSVEEQVILNDVANGVYYVRFVSSDRVITQKLTIE